MTTPSQNDKDSPVGSLAAAFQLALHQREFEISQLTQRNNFFMIFQGVLIAGLVQSNGSAAAAISFALCFIGLVVSIFQVGMAAGSKYWQVRWERAAKTTELWLLDALQGEPRISHFFTADGKDLTPAEIQQMRDINTNSIRQNDPLTMDVGSGETKNRIELGLGNPGWFKRQTNRLILGGFSVSRIPLYVGIALALFWTYLLSFTIAFNGSRLSDWLGSFCWIAKFTLVPFKGAAAS